MANNKFVIHVTGPSCSGKSGVNEVLGQRFPGSYLVSSDKMKWQLGGYSRTPENRKIVKEITLELFKIILQRGMIVLFNSYLDNEQEYLEIEKLAESYGYKFYNFELTAPYEILLERFRERQKAATEGRAKISVTDEQTFKEVTSRRSFVPTGSPVFDSSMMSAEAIADQIIKMLPQ